MVNYSQHVERKDGLAIYYFSFFEDDDCLVRRISNSGIKEKLHALSVAVAKDTHLRIQMPYWTNDDEFLMECRLFFNEQKKEFDKASKEILKNLRSMLNV